MGGGGAGRASGYVLGGAIAAERTEFVLVLTQGYFKVDLREREGERNVDRLPPVCAPTGTRTRSLGLCPDQNRTHHRLVEGMTLQPAEPLARALEQNFKTA